MDCPHWLVAKPVAHRGLHGGLDQEYPENSMAAFKRAADHGIPFEMDVQLAAGGSLVIMHDANLKRVSGENVALENVDHRTLQRIRIGSSGEPIPTLSSVLEEINGKVPIVIDVRRWRPSFSLDLERAIANTIRGYTGELALQSFDPISVLSLRRMTRSHPIGQISGSLKSANRLLGAIGRMMLTNFVINPDYISYELGSLPSRYVTYWRDKRMKPNITWNVTSEAEEDRAAQLADNFFFDGYCPRAYAKASLHLNINVHLEGE
jgi:glycerophosphoryl diester phosphodiesterase